jgi:hypothetical protein
MGDRVVVVVVVTPGVHETAQYGHWQPGYRSHTILHLYKIQFS